MRHAHGTTGEVVYIIAEYEREIGDRWQEKMGVDDKREGEQFTVNAEDSLQFFVLPLMDPACKIYFERLRRGSFYPCTRGRMQLNVVAARTSD